MATMTLAIPDEMRKRMRALPEMRWSEVARQAIAQRLEELEAIEKIARKSKLTQQDADEIAAKIKKGAAARFRAKYGLS